ncbi:alpha/beta hydrolase [Polaromonas sp.]|nr:alpha/beta hydrolase [Candidatus Saccharibacteria bacterium]
MTDSSVTSRLIEVNDVNVYVEDYGGSGRPVVLIHGWPLSAESWKMQVPALKDAGYRVLAYDRRGFGRSDKPSSGYDYDTLTDDLNGIITMLDLNDVTLVGFSMGGGEVARYIAKYGEARLHSVVFASAVPPMLLKTDDNPDGPLDQAKADEMTANLTDDESAFYDQFTKVFFSPNGDGNILISEEQRQEALALCMQADKTAALTAMKSFATTDFRDDLKQVTVPTLVMHGDADGTVPYPGSGERIHAAIPHSELHVIIGGPHGVNVSHSDEFNTELLRFLSA